MTEIADRYRRAAAGFGQRVDSVPPGDARWQCPSPCAGWNALDVVRHVIDAHHHYFGLVDHDRLHPRVDDEPAAAWRATSAAMTTLLNDPTVAARDDPRSIGTSTWEQSVDRLVSADVLVHTWDLAQALGVDDRLPIDDVRRVHAAWSSMSDALRRHGGVGPQIDPPPDPSPQDALLAFLGRDPRWTRP